MSDYIPHYSVMLRECLSAMKLGAKSSGLKTFADLTFGAGGHSFALSDHLPGSMIFSTDQDPDALKNGQDKILDAGKGNCIKLLPMNFCDFPDWCEGHGMNGKFAGILIDLGVSSHQFDKMERGFSFRADAPLDMRMNHLDSSLPTAADLLNSLTEKEIADLIYKYGEERLSRKIARRIVELREREKISSTGQIEDICFHAYAPKDRHGKTHPATRTFQALRIAVNDELKVLENTLPKLLPCLAVGGVLAVISFHSLEDRIVKHTFKELVEKKDFPAMILSKKPLTPSEEELLDNTRSRSAKLRLIQRVSQSGEMNGTEKKRQKKINFQ